MSGVRTWSPFYSRGLEIRFRTKARKQATSLILMDYLDVLILVFLKIVDLFVFIFVFVFMENS